MQMAYKCGHAGEVPRNMGRGAARQKRLARWFRRLCPDCNRARWVAHYAQEHHLDGTPYTADKQARCVELMMTTWECISHQIQL